MTDPTKPLVIFVPGLFASTLAPAEGGLKRKWNPPLSGFLSLAQGKLGHKDLKLPTTWTINEEGIYIQDEDDIKADGCLRVVQNKLLVFLEALHNNSLIDLHKIVWDWRRSFEESEGKIAEEIASICSNDSRKASLLTHGSGAMLSWPTISRNPEWFSSWMNTSGLTLHGNSKYLKEFNHGLTQMVGKKPLIKALSEDAIFSFPGLYSYFPIKGEPLLEGHGETNLVKPDGSYCTFDEIDLHNVSTWEELSLGIFAWKEDEVSQEEKDHIQHSLDAAKRFRKMYFVREGGPEDNSYLEKDLSAYDHLKITCYGNDQFQTHSAYEVNLEEKSIDVSKSKVTCAGDKSLPGTTWQTIPGGLKADIVMSEKRSTHVTMVNDKKLRYLLMDTFFEEDEDKKALCAHILKGMEEGTDQAKLIAAVFLIFSFILGYGGLKLVIDVVGFLYPAYMTLQYDPRVAPQDAVQWLTYWIVYYTLYMTEGLLPFIFTTIPYYYSAKMGVYLWLAHPDTNGARVVFNQLIRPTLEKRKKKGE
jgi:receptor expression-enhancing protein 5/6